MGIGTSDGQYYEDEMEYHMDIPSEAPLKITVNKLPEKDLIEQGNINLDMRPIVQNEDGSVSTVRSMSFEQDGRHILVPTVLPGRGIVSDEEAIQNFNQTGEHLGIFSNPDAATAYAEALHQSQEQKFNPNSTGSTFVDEGNRDVPPSTSPFEIAAQRNRQAVRPMIGADLPVRKGRIEGRTTKILDSIGEDVRRTMTLPRRMVEASANQFDPSLMGSEDVVRPEDLTGEFVVDAALTAGRPDIAFGKKAFRGSPTPISQKDVLPLKSDGSLDWDALLKENQQSLENSKRAMADYNQKIAIYDKEVESFINTIDETVTSKQIEEALDDIYKQLFPAQNYLKQPKIEFAKDATVAKGLEDWFTSDTKLFDKKMAKAVKDFKDGIEQKLEDLGEAGNKLAASVKAKAGVYAKHLKETSWENFQTSVKNDIIDVLPADVAKKARAVGFNTDVPLYKGGKSGYIENIPDPSKKGGERGFFLSDDPNVAKRYMDSTFDDPAVYFARATKPMIVDWKEATGKGFYEFGPMHGLIEAARQKSADMLIVKNVSDIGGKQTQYVVIDPSILRSPRAEFDPTKLHINHVYLSLGGGFLPMSIVSLDDKR